MEKITQQVSNFFMYMDRITKPVDILWHMFCRYVGQIIVVIGILTFNPEVIILGILMFGVYLVNQAFGNLQAIGGELNHIHQWLVDNSRVTIKDERETEKVN